VKFLGVFLRPPEQAYEQHREYTVGTSFDILHYGALVDWKLMPSEDDEESKKWWDEQNVCFRMRQENIVCPEFNVTFPRLNAYARVVAMDGKDYDYNFMVNY
jgi:hypothetical protein